MAMATTATRLLDNYIGGRWTPASGSETLDVANPANGEVLAAVPLSAPRDLDAAVRAARDALPEWRAVSAIPCFRGTLRMLQEKYKVKSSREEGQELTYTSRKFGPITT